MSELEAKRAALSAEATETQDALSKRKLAMAALEVQQSELKSLIAEQQETRAAGDSAATQLAALREEIAAAEAAKASLTEETTTLMNGLDDLKRAHSETMDRQAVETQAAKDRVAALTREIGALETQVATLQKAAEAPPTQPATFAAQVPVATPQITAPTTPKRSPVLVASALQRAPGLAGAGADEMSRLNSLLVDGVCPTDALADVFGQINRQTLVALFRTLGGC